MSPYLPAFISFLYAVGCVPTEKHVQHSYLKPKEL